MMIDELFSERTMSNLPMNIMGLLIAYLIFRAVQKSMSYAVTFKRIERETKILKAENDEIEEIVGRY